MGQKSNLITLRTSLKKNLNFLNNNKELKVFLIGFKYLNLLERFLSKKNILLVDKELIFVGNRCDLNLVLFY
jgi:hypothetical protein